jgi:hypothetical protein
MRLLISVLFLSSSYAQITWQGLQFGMNRQQVKDSLSAKSFSTRDSRDATIVTVDPDFELKTNSAILSSNFKTEVASASMFFKPDVAFGAQSGLQTIKLELDQAKIFQSAPAFQSSLPLLTTIAGTSAYEQLTGKYGPPVSKRGPCDDIPLASLIGSIQECSAKWKDNGQTIELFWSYNWHLRNLSFSITYSATASGL